MTALALSDDPDPSSLMRPDPDRLHRFADRLATDGEADLSHLVHRVADDVKKALRSGSDQAEPSAASSASASVASL
ncbi:hypothetical protein [Rubrivirga sp.]|uniref:hypothetical protein n=1 Tax=Rubrivirga sp. TaxID=1885344 RepID=UPI003B524275